MFLRDDIKVWKVWWKFLKNPVKSLLERLQTIINGQDNCIKYTPEELYTQWAFFRAKNLFLKGEFILYCIYMRGYVIWHAVYMYTKCEVGREKNHKKIKERLPEFKTGRGTKSRNSRHLIPVNWAMFLNMLLLDLFWMEAKLSSQESHSGLPIWPKRLLCIHDKLCVDERSHIPAVPVLYRNRNRTLNILDNSRE